MFPLDTKILIVDDSVYFRKDMKDRLWSLNYRNVLEADGVKLAKQILVEREQIKKPVQLVFTDVHMQEETGIDLIRWLREVEKFRLLPVIVLTTSQEKGEILEAAKMSVSHFIIKPFNTETLTERMETTWARQGRRYVEYLLTGR